MMVSMTLGDITTHILLFLSLYFEVFLLLTFIEHRHTITKAKISPEEPEYFPTITVIVPVWNEEKTLSVTMKSLLSLNYPKDKLSIIAVDDGSTDGTWKALQDFSKEPQVSLFKKENGGKYTALNFALEKIKSDLVGCLDADCSVDTEALRRIVKKFEDKSVMAVTPSIKILNPKNPIELVQRAEFAISAFIRYVFGTLNAQYITPGPLSVFRKSVFDKLGPYKHAYLTEDMEIAMRMQKNKMKIANVHNAYVYTVPQPTVYRMYKQRLRWIYGGMNNLRDYRFMLFTKEYGTLSIFILPIVAFTLFATMYFIGLIAKTIVVSLADKIIEIQTIGLSYSMPKLHIDWFFLQTGSLSVLGLFFISLVLVTILMGKHIAGERVYIGRDALFYILLYGIISPFWFVRAAYNTVFARKTTWR